MLTATPTIKAKRAKIKIFLFVAIPSLRIGYHAPRFQISLREINNDQKQRRAPQVKVSVVLNKKAA
jgi:hypothetical protein